MQQKAVVAVEKKCLVRGCPQGLSEERPGGARDLERASFEGAFKREDEGTYGQENEGTYYGRAEVAVRQ